MFGLCLFCFSTTSYAQAPYKIAFVDIEKAIAGSSLLKTLTEKYEAEFVKRQNDLKALETNLLATRQQASKDRLTMSIAERETMQADLLRKERELRFQSTNLEEDFKIINSRVNRQVEQAVFAAVREIAQAEAFDLVLTTGVLISSARVDITDKVIAKLQ